MKKPVIHYSGGLKIYSNGGVHEWLAGWPCCGSGEFAYKTRRQGNQSHNKEDVTCKKCLTNIEKSIIVTVCDSCLCASCLAGEFYCEDYKTAGTTEKTISELRKLNREHEDWFNPPKNLVPHCE